MELLHFYQNWKVAWMTYKQRSEKDDSENGLWVRVPRDDCVGSIKGGSVHGIKEKKKKLGQNIDYIYHGGYGVE